MSGTLFPLRRVGVRILTADGRNVAWLGFAKARGASMRLSVEEHEEIQVELDRLLLPQEPRS